MILETYVLNESEFSDVDSVLRRRGHQILDVGNRSATLAPITVVLEDEETADVTFEYSESRFEAAKLYLKYFGHRNFRNLLRTLIEAPGQEIDYADLQTKCSNRRLDPYLAALELIGLIACRDGTVALTKQVNNLGPSLEQYVAEICARDLRGSAEWGVKLKQLPKAGGDFDVLAWLEPSLVYVECKSGSPKNIDQSHVAHYLQREFELAAEISIFLLDTGDALGGFIERVFDPVIKRGLESRSLAPIMKPLPGYKGVFGGYRNVFVTNSDPSILTQIQRCLQAYYALM